MRAPLSLLLLSLVACSSSTFDVAGAGDAELDASADASFDSPDLGLDDTAMIDVPVESPSDASSDAPEGPCDPAKPPPTNAVYASTASPSGDGSRLSPFHTIGEAITAARARKLGTVIVDEGSYTEVVRFLDSDPGVFVEGGWKREADTWKRRCDSSARDRTVIESSAIVAVFVENVVHLSGLRRMTVRTKIGGGRLPDGAGESLFGVRVRGDGSLFALHDVVIAAGTGGSGTPGLPTTLPPVACNGTTDCSDGGNGPPGSTGTKAIAGSFTSGGYQTGDGANGSAGGNGRNGTAGSSNTVSCVTNCGEGMCFTIADCPKTTAPTTSSGKCGCGGAGGAGGTGGPGGGAAVALFVSGTGAKVNVTKSALRSGAGGYGAGANAGGVGSSGASGKPGEAISCPGSCTSATSGLCGGTGAFSCTKGPNVSASAPAAGGSGGTGGKGGDGAGGAGGPSHAIVVVGSADAIVDPMSELKPSAGGMGLNGAPNGASSAIFVQP